MPWPYIAPIALLLCSNVFMTFAWVSRGLPQANEMVRRTISSGERPELERGAGGLLQDSMRNHHSFWKEAI